MMTRETIQRGRIAPMTAALLIVLASPFAHSQTQNTPNTLALDASSQRPKATIDRVAWLAGAWTGNGLGGETEEVWSEPSGGTMACTFKLLHDGKPAMYEFGLIVEEGESLVLKLKHFHPSFTGWEEPDKYISFPLVKLTNDAVYFDGLTYRREGEERLQVFVAMRKDGAVSEAGLSFERRSSGREQAGKPQKEKHMQHGKMKKMTPMLAVERIEPSLAFWTNGLGFRNAGEVGEKGALDFVMLQRDGIEVMFLSHASLEKDATKRNTAVPKGVSLLFIEVDDIDQAIAQIEDVKIVTPKHDEFYGMTEITIKEPGGHLVTFAAKTKK